MSYCKGSKVSLEKQRCRFAGLFAVTTKSESINMHSKLLLVCVGFVLCISLHIKMPCENFLICYNYMHRLNNGEKNDIYNFFLAPLAVTQNWTESWLA